MIRPKAKADPTLCGPLRLVRIVVMKGRKGWGTLFLKAAQGWGTLSSKPHKDYR
jgi:hypothetical protein